MVAKIAIVGISGSGKSVFSRKLAVKTGLPLVHMDQLFWKGNWEAIPEVDYLRAHEELVKKDQWIIEGYVDVAMASRLRSADKILYLDFPGWLCAYRLVKRWLFHRKESRPELPKEALEKFDHRFFWTVLTKAERKQIEAALEGVDVSKIDRILSPGELRRYFEALRI